jgi:hypothetical protein
MIGLKGAAALGFSAPKTGTVATFSNAAGDVLAARWHALDPNDQ